MMGTEQTESKPNYTIKNGHFNVAQYTGAENTPMRYGQLINNTPTTGRTLLFVPGLGGSIKPAIPFLSLLLPYYDAIYGPDLRGYGLNPLEKPIKSADWHLKDLSCFLENTQLLNTPHLDLFGISLGGALSTFLAVQHNSIFKHLMLMSPAFKGVEATFPLSYQIKNIIGRVFQGQKHRIQLPYGINQLTQNKTITQDPNHRESTKFYLTIDYLLSVKALTNKAFQLTKSLITPTMIMVPELDVICDPAAMKQAYGQIPDLTPKHLAIYPELFHDILLETEHPQAASDIIQWLNYSGLN